MSIYTEEAERRFTNKRDCQHGRQKGRCDSCEVDRLERMEPAFEAMREALRDALTEIVINPNSVAIPFVVKKARAALTLADKVKPCA